MSLDDYSVNRILTRDVFILCLAHKSLNEKAFKPDAKKRGGQRLLALYVFSCFSMTTAPNATTAGMCADVGTSEGTNSHQVVPLEKSTD
ncbi:hypothetical protein [Stenotrophomonas terrae]|uniref:hypothetical protein n=1 Tax=Stenotrophomonas terrae TaxID=405446 RepID=UPI00128EA555|nr:hypothetical protein [Stenotrophomonas terrae]